jgi:hypothetical protein
MTAVCDCDSEHLISTNTRKSLTICVTARFEEIIAHHSFHVTKFYEGFALSVFLLYSSVVCVAYVNHLKAVIASVGCHQ